MRNLSCKCNGMRILCIYIFKQSDTDMIDTPKMNDTDDKNRDQVTQEDSEAKYKRVEEITHLYDALLQD